MAIPKRWATRPVRNAEEAGAFLTAYRQEYGVLPERALVSPHAKAEVPAVLRQAGVHVLLREYVLAWEVWLGPLPEEQAVQPLLPAFGELAR